MSSKLALLLKQKCKYTEDVVVRQDARPTKRLKRAAGKSKTAAAANGSQQLSKPPTDQPFLRNAAADVEDDELDAPASADAYSALVGMLSSQQGALGAALKQRQLQQAGASDASESESGDDDDDDDGNDDSGTELSDDDNKPAGRDGQAAAAAAEPEGDDADISSDGEQTDQEDHAATATAANGSHKQKRKGSKQVAVAAAAGGAEGSFEPAAAAAAVVSNSSSTWDWFMSRELSDQEVSALRAGRPTWQELLAAQDTLEGTWKRAKLQVAGRSDLPQLHQHLADYGVKERLIARWKEVHKADAERLASHHTASTSISSKQQQQTTGDFTSRQQQALFSLCDSYADVFYAAKPYPGGPGWSAAEPDQAVDAVLLHVLNHCAKTADVIKRNNDRIKAADEGDVSAVPRDQGFTRPKALILLPMRNMAFQLVRRLVALAQKETRADSVQGKEKFLEQFVGDGDDDQGDAQQQQQEDGDGSVKKKTKGAVKPAEHRALFRGNLDDHFRFGIRITRGQIKLFADLLQSDIIVASPVGLATKLAEDATAAAGGADKGKGRGGKGGAAAGSGAAAAAKGGECDFLSSIEVCVLERADVMLMQNWQHVITVLESLNQLPKQQHGTDIMRVRLHLLASQGQLYRQTIITSSFPAPQINAAFNQLCSSHAGKFKLVTQPTGVLAQVVPQVRQVFERFSAASAAAAADARFEFFKVSIWPRVTEGGSGGLMVVVPSYFDFVRVRNFLKSEEADFTVLSEYCSFSAVTRSRAVFFQRRKRVLLYTERAHFYNRYRIRGIQDIVFYGLPDHAHFYSEVVNLVQSGPGSSAAAHHATITALFCKFDALALARIVGHSRAAKMLTADTTTFMFC